MGLRCARVYVWVFGLCVFWIAGYSFVFYFDLDRHITMFNWCVGRQHPHLPVVQQQEMYRCSENLDLTRCSLGDFLT